MGGGGSGEATQLAVVPACGFGGGGALSVVALLVRTDCHRLRVSMHQPQDKLHAGALGEGLHQVNKVPHAPHHDVAAQSVLWRFNTLRVTQALPAETTKERLSNRKQSNLS
jgi:hypothetical protein